MAEGNTIAVNAIARGDRRFGWMLTAPGLLLLGVVIAFPIAWAGLTSLYDFTLINPHFDRFTGLDNYAQALGREGFRHAIWVTLTFIIAVVALEFAVGLAVAVMLHNVERGRRIYYAILLCPLLINPVIVGLIWRMFLHPTLGIVNYVIGRIGVAPINWLGDYDIAFWTLIMVDIWHQVSFMVILLLAGLSALPREPYEAARMEGASTLQAFYYVTLPLMRPVIAVTLLIRLIFAVKTFDLVFIMTRGGPGTSTDLISYYIYRSAFFGLNIGLASAISVLLLVIVLAMTAYLYRYMRSLT
jgi:multiple sugar transport system permease protein